MLLRLAAVLCLALPLAAQDDEPLPEGAARRLGTARWKGGYAMYGVAWSPDGKTLATAGGESFVRLWDARTGERTGALAGDGPALTAVAWSPDGKRVAAGGYDERVRVWDAASGRLEKSLEVPEAEADVLAWSADSKRLAVGTSAGGVTVFPLDGDGGPATLDFRRDGAPALAFAPGGARLYVAGDRALEECETETLARVRQLGFEVPVRGLALSPDGATVAVGTAGEGVRLVPVKDWSAGARLAAEADDLHVHAIAWSPDGARLAVAAADQRVRLWRVEGAKLERVLEGWEEDVTALAFSPDGGTLAVGNTNDALQLFDAATGERRFSHAGHLGPVRALAWSPDGTRLLSGGFDDRVVIWEAASGRPARELPRTPGAVWGVAWSADGGKVAWAAWPGRVGAETADTGAELLAYDLEAARAVAWSPDGDLAASTAGGEVVKFPAGETLPAWDDFELNGDLTGLAWSPDGSLLAAGGSGDLALLDTASGTPRAARTDEPAIVAVAWSPGGSWLAAAGSNGVALHDAGTLARRTRLEPRAAAGAVAVSPDGWLLAAGLADGRVLVWELATRRLVRTFTGHRAAVHGLAFSPDAETLASGSDDATVLLWKLAPPGAAMAREEAWEALAGSDAAAAWTAAGSLAADAKEAAWLAARLRDDAPAAPADPAPVRREIARLGADDAAERAAAVKALEKLGSRAETALRAAAASPDDPEIAAAAARLVGRLEGDRVRSPFVRRQLRGVRVLERAGGTEALAALRALAAASPSARVRRDAAAAAERLAARPRR